MRAIIDSMFSTNPLIRLFVVIIIDKYRSLAKGSSLLEHPRASIWQKGGEKKERKKERKKPNFLLFAVAAKASRHERVKGAEFLSQLAAPCCTPIKSINQSS